MRGRNLMPAGSEESLRLNFHSVDVMLQFLKLGSMVLLRHLRVSLIKGYCRWTQIGFARLCHKLAPCCSRTLLQGTHESTRDRVDSKQPLTQAPFIKVLSSTGTTDTGPVVWSRPIQPRIKIGDANSPWQFLPR